MLSHTSMSSTRAALLLIAVLLAACSDPSREIEAREAFELARADRMTIIDIRLQSEWRETGVGEGVERMNMAAFSGRKAFSEAVLERVGSLEAPIALIGKDGTRSSKLVPIMREYGFTDVRHIPEGMMGKRRQEGWIAKGLPVVSCGDC